jgi:hypothetical protein
VNGPEEPTLETCPKCQGLGLLTRDLPGDIVEGRRCDLCEGDGAVTAIIASMWRFTTSAEPTRPLPRKRAP